MDRLSKFTCGHIGRTNNGPDSKAQAFIRVAEIRNSPVDEVPKKCPGCENHG